MEKKYKLTDEIIKYKGHTLHRIEALKDFNDVYKGDKGGFVEFEKNLSQKDDCWIYNNAVVCNQATVSGNAKIYNSAIISENAYIGEKAIVKDNTCIFGHASIFNNAVIGEKARIYDNADVFGSALVIGYSSIYGKATICRDTVVNGHSNISDTIIDSDIIILDAEIHSKRDYIIFKNWWSSGRYFVWTRSNNMWKVGCFHGTGEELIAKAYKDSKLSGREYERVVNYVKSILEEYNH